MLPIRWSPPVAAVWRPFYSSEGWFLTLTTWWQHWTVYGIFLFWRWMFFSAMLNKCCCCRNASTFQHAQVSMTSKSFYCFILVILDLLPSFRRFHKLKSHTTHRILINVIYRFLFSPVSLFLSLSFLFPAIQQHVC